MMERSKKGGARDMIDVSFKQVADDKTSTSSDSALELDIYLLCVLYHLISYQKFNTVPQS
ncbi:hypothetical protein DPMN_028973 [Dreissena polymorpha]|uniref:Uncharacterized protein n=1 Tax=Dreissena polymorpha TaxID=45954 RepID=A0A9D4LXQ3_DREPO|nr:hypothetical protein DPMN_028973 [Dreissena polymorpha]